MNINTSDCIGHSSFRSSTNRHTNSLPMFQTSNLVYESVNLTDELKIGLEYDRHHGQLNIFVKNIGNSHHNLFPTQIHIHSNETEVFNHPSTQFQQDQISDSFSREENEPKICIEFSNIYVYDIDEENENIPCETIITSPSLLFSSSSSSCCDDQTIDNDDGYSTHSVDDTEQQQSQSLSIPPSKYIIPFVPHHPDEFVSSLRRLINQLIWLNPFKKTVQQMMIHHLFN